jgi:hypothetical protein
LGIRGDLVVIDAEGVDQDFLNFLEDFVTRHAAGAR